MRDLNLIEALQRLTSIAMEKVRAAGIVTKDVVLMLVDTIMSVAVDTIQKSRKLSPFNRSILKS
ncbi:hypothetical protein [Desulfogranum marinum]|uniref:hypothetical protein n=1 Tax=Desulfogranum marinum TaxID=453220 RepID=UPI0019665270|nr:hypothetical protein [Desulfogranum marinum]MBM9513980.1 hypothetical protein [Desulfogranum marinum]